uniref:WD-repeat protein n=2 Tax=Solanum tuberosum TaxID=4113 RepID=M1C0R8_SOLTU
MEGVSAAEVRNGAKDIQGIQWYRRTNITREEVRQRKLRNNLRNRGRNIPQSGETPDKEHKTIKKDCLYDFRMYARSSVRPSFSNPRLRNMVWATSKHDVYLMSDFSAVHWSSLTCTKTEILDFSGHVVPLEKHPKSFPEGFTATRVSTLAVKDKLLLAGGLQGELIVKYLDKPGVSFCFRPTYDDDDAITTCIEINNSASGALHFIVSYNDSGVREFDMETFQQSNYFHFSWPVNHTSLSPDGKLLIIVGDDPEGMLVDSRNGMAVSSLSGHVDYSYASAWHPDGQTFATGNEDNTCRIWDIRNLSKSVTVLKGTFGPIVSIRYTSDGRYMAMAEHEDFVHIFDVKSGYVVEQEIDFFGEVSGVSFSPDTESLFIGVKSFAFNGLLEFGRRHNNSYLDAMI